MAMLLAVLGSALVALPLASAASLDLRVGTGANFTIAVDGQVWLSGAEVAVGGHSAADGSLVTMGAATTSSGTDPLGAYSATTLKWAAASAPGAALMHTSFRTYASDAGMVVFEQSFPTALHQSDSESAAALATARENAKLLDDRDQCRVHTTTGMHYTQSKNGYNAFTPSSGKAGFEEHKNAYCDDGGGNNGHKYAYHGDLSEEACAAKCTELKCTCYDYKNGAGPGPGPSPSKSASAQSVFPGFARAVGPSGGDMPCFSYHGVFPGMQACSSSTYKESHQGGAPLVLYDGANKSLPMVVFSPLNFPKAHHMTSGSHFFGAGVKSTVTDIPAGWSQLFLLSAGSGINDGMMAWGDRMLKFTGKARADMYLDQTHSTIGFWTDNGGYYHYATGVPNADGSKCKAGDCTSYESVLPKVKAYHDSIGVPFGHWQFDSWFYPKDGGVNAGGGGGAVTNWTADPGIFPHGMANIEEKLGLPIVMHNRQWSDHSDYIKHLPQYKWYTDKYAVPEDPIAFFSWFFQQQKGWGLSMYEQDWMCTEYDGVAHLQTNISLGDLWLKGMATGAALSNRSVQYCMPYPYDLLSASAYSAVTNARASGDYFHAHDQWSVGGTSLFYWAIGILPFKDGFYSSTNKQVGGQTVGPEPNPDREALMATLSCAMVGPMDGINLLNKTRTMTACRSDGTVLKPDKPVSSTDWCFSNGVPTCRIFHTYSDLKGLGRVHYHFNNNDKNSAGSGEFDAGMVNLKSGDDYVFYNWYSGKVSTLAEAAKPEAGYEGHTYAVVTPVLADWAFVGEPNKFVTAASLRFTDVSASVSKLTVSVTGMAKESVEVCAAHKASGWALQCKSVASSAGGAQTVTFTA